MMPSLVLHRIDTVLVHRLSLLMDCPLIPHHALILQSIVLPLIATMMDQYHHHNMMLDPL